MKIIPTILCGGAGSRLWPVSRESHPKPFIRLADNESFLQKSFHRGAILPDVHEILTVTNRDLLFKTKDDYREINTGFVKTSFLLEPFARNTAAAVALAALYVQKQHGDDALMLILTADHLIADQAAFALAVQHAATIATTGKIVTFGIQPTTPETGYGYIEAQKDLSITAGNQILGFEVLCFVEKPDLATAEAYVASGKFYWNSGMFCFSAQTLISEMQQHSPDILVAAKICFDASLAQSTDIAQIEFDADTFANVPSNSIDYAVMEKSKNVAVVPCSIGWSDIGAWDAMSNLTEPDAAGNRIDGSAIINKSRDCYVHSNQRMIAVLGMQNALIIDTPDALLIADKNHVQDVKEIYAQLKKENHDAHKIHQTVFRPWGTYTVLEEGPHFKIKRIVVKPHSSLSLQSHEHRNEHWVVVEGAATVTNGLRTFTVNTNESTYIPAGNKHRLENTTNEPLAIIEVQSGNYLGEDDIMRYDDQYGRS